VTDLFAVLGLPRRPWLDAEEIKQRHHVLMASGSVSSATLLNEARRTLDNPALRIRLYLALEFPEYHPTTRLQLDWDFFLKVGEATRQATELAARKSSLTHPLARAAIQKEILTRREALGLLKEEIEKRLTAADDRLQTFEKNPEELTVIAEEFAFLQKNETFVREALLALYQGLA